LNSVYRDARLGRIVLTLAVGPPRSVSTALSLALAQSPDIHCYLHEPFANDYSGVPSERGGERILAGHIARMQAKKKPDDASPLHILIKESSQHFRPSFFRRFAPYCRNVIILVRSPLLQLSSVVRTCKWIWNGCPPVSRREVLKLEPKDIKRFSRNDDLLVYFIHAWKRLAGDAAFLKESMDVNWIGVDAELSRIRPDETLRRISKMLKIRYSPRMESGWDRNGRADLGQDEWSRRSSRARKLYSPERRFPGLDAFPQEWRKMIQRAYSVYTEILGHDHFIHPRTLHHIRRLMAGIEGSNLSFSDIAPDTCYALARNNGSNSPALIRIRSDLRLRYLRHSEIFDMIDHASAR